MEPKTKKVNFFLVEDEEDESLQMAGSSMKQYRDEKYGNLD